MQISVTSNVVSAFYLIVFNVLLQVLLVHLVKIFLSSRNLRTIYEDRKQTKLGSTRLALFTNQGLTTAGHGRCMAVLSTTILFLSIAGSFSINGFSEDRITKQRASAVVDLCSGNNCIDYTKHVMQSNETQLLSGTFLVADSARKCGRANGLSYARFSAVNNLSDLQTIKYPRRVELSNSTCRMEEYGLVDKVAFRHKTVIRSTSWSMNCSLSFKFDTTEMLTKAHSHTSSDCEFEVMEIWCSALGGGKCVALIKIEEGFTTAVMKYRLAENGSEQGTAIMEDWQVQGEALEDRISSTSLRSMVYMSSLDMFDTDQKARAVSMLTVQRDVTIGVLNGEIQKTQINTLLLALTLGPALFLLLLLSVSAFASRARYVTRAGRQRYNPFYSAGDMLSCAAVEAKREGGCRIRREECLVIGVFGGELWVGEKFEKDEDGENDNSFTESDSSSP